MSAIAANSPPQIRTSEAKDGFRPLRKIESTPVDKYRIGEIGKPWGPSEKAQWLAQTVRHRSYQDEVVSKLRKLDRSVFTVVQYGALKSDPEGLPLLAVVSNKWDDSRPTCLVTGGVHGYETSGVQGAILFLQSRAKEYCDRANLVVIPCVSPWGYERIERWNISCQDPNRSFGKDPKTHTEESAAVKSFLSTLNVPSFLMHIDCHETTDTDETEYMPARAALNGAVYKRCAIPDGFYLVGDVDEQKREWHLHMIEAVKKVTHIAPPGMDGTIIEEPVVMEGVIEVPVKKLGLCASVTGTAYNTTTEVYPDSKREGVDDDQCNRAQVAVITSGLDFVLAM